MYSWQGKEDKVIYCFNGLSKSDYPANMGVLNNYGYQVINRVRTLHPPGMNIVDAAGPQFRNDIFGITIQIIVRELHQEFQRAIELNKPRRFIAHSFVIFQENY